MSWARNLTYLSQYGGRSRHNRCFSAALVVCSLDAATMLAAKKKRTQIWCVEHSASGTGSQWYECSISRWTSVHSRNNKISNENSSSSLAGSKRFFLHSICLARARTNEPAANLLHQSRDIDSILMQQVRSRFATRFWTKKVESWLKTCRKSAWTCRNSTNNVDR